MDLLLKFEPQKLSFQFELNKQLSSSIRLMNETPNHVAFKLLTTNPKNYGVQPRFGILRPGSSRQITVKMRAVKKAPTNMKCKDKFMIQSVVANSGATSQDAQNLFKKESAHLLQEYKIPVVYILSPPPVTEKSMESSLVTSEVTNSEVKTHNNVLQSSRKLLDVRPPELQFPFKPEKELSCSLQLSNTTENQVAFMVKIPNPKYCVQPSCGIVLPKSTCNVTGLQEQNKVPSLMQCEDKFLIQSAVASPTKTTTEDIIPDMFGKSGSIFEECELGVVNILEEEDKHGIHNIGALIVSGIIICLLGLVSWYLMKQTLSLIGSLTVVTMMLMIKMIKKLVSESVEDWIVKTLMHICKLLFFKCREILRPP